jgi:hypothetical protein
MHSRPIALATALLALSACETVGDVVGTGFNVELGGASEVPGPGDPDGRGFAEISIVGRFDRLCYELTALNIEPATAAHIHRGAAGSAGPPVVVLDAPSDGESTGCLRLEPGLAEEIERNPAAFYVNVHDAAFPNGAIRGQLRR